MTIIAATPDGIYYDKQGTACGLISSIEKVYKLSETVYAAGAGSSASLSASFQEFEKGLPIHLDNSDTIVFIDIEKQEYRLLDKNREGGIKYEDIKPVPIDNLYTLGSGSYLYCAFFSKYKNYRTAAIKTVKHANGCGMELWLLTLKGETIRCL